MKRYGAELIGTFVLVFGGIGTAVLAGHRVGWIGVGLAFGLALMAMIYAIGPISGCHINPSVSLGLLMTRKMPREHFVGYVVAQLIGAILGAGAVLIIAKGAAGGYDASAAGFACNGYGEHSPGGYSVFAGFLSETLLTALLVFTVLGATDVRAPVGFAGVAIGFVLVLIHLVGIPVTNLSVNPVRSIATAIYTGGWALAQLWLFIVAPLLGGFVAAVVYRLVAEPPSDITARKAEQATARQQAERA